MEGGTSTVPGPSSALPATDEVPQNRLADCLARVAAQETAALRELINLTEPKARAIATRMLRDSSEVDDVLQDVYITIWRKASQYDAGRAHGMAWITVVTRNRCLDRLRHRAKQQRYAEEFGALQTILAKGSGDNSTRSLDGELEGRLEELDPLTRDAIKAAFYEGHTYEALARAQGIPLPTMKSRIRRGLLVLRSVLRP